jgi:integrase
MAPKLSTKNRPPFLCFLVFVIPYFPEPGVGLFAVHTASLLTGLAKEDDLTKKKARVKKGTFHYLRRTAICDWLSQVMTEYDVMKPSVHSEFSTTHKHYLSVRYDLFDRARLSTAHRAKKLHVQLSLTKQP